MPAPPPPEPSPSPRKLEEIVADQQGILSPNDTATKAGEKMRSLHSDSLPVSEGRRLVGMVDEKHPDRVAASHGHDPNVVRIGESMNRNLVYCFEDQGVAEALRIMDEAQLSLLPVVDRQMRIVGMVKREELSK